MKKEALKYLGFIKDKFNAIEIADGSLIITQKFDDLEIYIFIDLLLKNYTLKFKETITVRINYYQVQEEYLRITKLSKLPKYFSTLRTDKRNISRIGEIVLKSDENNSLQEVHFLNIINQEIENQLELNGTLSKVVINPIFHNLEEFHKLIFTPTEVQYLIIVKLIEPNKLLQSYNNVRDRLQSLLKKYPHLIDVKNRIDLIDSLVQQN